MAYKLLVFVTFLLVGCAAPKNKKTTYFVVGIGVIRVNAEQPKLTVVKSSVLGSVVTNRRASFGYSSTIEVEAYENSDSLLEIVDPLFGQTKISTK